MQEIREKLKAQQKEAKKKKVKETTGVPCAVVISSEGIRTVERGTKVGCLLQFMVLTCL